MRIRNNWPLELTILILLSVSSTTAYAFSTVHTVTEVATQAGTGGGLTFFYVEPATECGATIASTETQPLLEIRLTFLAVAMTALKSGKFIKIGYSCNGTTAVVQYINMLR